MMKAEVSSSNLTTPKCLLCHSERLRRYYRKGGLNFCRCRRCGLVQQVPVPSSTALAAFYANSDWNQKLASGAPVYTGRDLAFLQGLQERFAASGPLLDVGAGPGFLVKAALQMGWEVHAIEIADQDVTRLRDLADVTIHPGTVRDADLPNAYFRTITMSHSLEHMRHPIDDLRHLSDAAVQGCLMHIAVPNWRSAQRLAAGRHVPWIGFPHISYFDRETLSQALRKAGFEVLEVTTHVYPQPDYYFWFGLVRRLRLERIMRRWFGLAHGVELEDLIADNPPVNCPWWRVRWMDKVACAFLGIWPKKWAAARGWGDELRITARKT